MTLNICIITPEEIFLNDEAEEIILPTNTGQMGVLSNHAPLITALDIGVMLIRKTKTWNSFVLMGGFALIKENKITILINEIENEEKIDTVEAEKNFLIAKQNFENATNAKEKVETNFSYKRARARLQATK
uniref:ATP synthase epsilon chain, chloroplastic n=1 Tax=Derbesia sp. WEST4838 TaxID=1847751 RepID=A0A1C9JBG9_9CHLO|nr:ATP synthase CF1 subunit epsilon [Derbesia sp. WEST4838]AOP19192.1 ATP synthase CF1 subunit epsilon [Derbesia sp. WEST4838]